MRQTAFLAIVFTLALGLAAGPSTADTVIYSGIDTWRTPGTGSTFYDFASNPLPAGFFCQQSAPFTSRVAFRGVPIVTGQPGELGATDTIIQRLDDVRFDARGQGSGRLQVRALQLESVAPIDTACGRYDIQVRLTGNQPITRMDLSLDGLDGGPFLAPLVMNVKISFIPVSGRNRQVREATRQIRFPASPGLRWTSDLAERKQFVGTVKVDTDGDLKADTYLPGTSNFRVQRAPGKATGDPCEGYTVPTADEPCHCNGREQHCTY